MIATVTIDPDGCVTAILESDDELPTELVGLTADDLLDHAGRAAISAWIDLHCEPESDDQ